MENVEETVEDWNETTTSDSDAFSMLKQRNIIHVDTLYSMKSEESITTSLEKNLDPCKKSYPTHICTPKRKT